MKIQILGGTPGPRPKRGGQASTRDRGVMAITAGAGPWAMVNMSPTVAHRLDLQDAQRMQSAPQPTRAVLLTDAQVDHVTGLLSLRDGAPIDLYATPAVFEDLSATLPVLSVLQHYCGVHWHIIPVAGDRQVASFQVAGLPSLEWTAIAVDAPAPPFSQHSDHPVTGDTIALAVRDTVTGQRVFCAPGLAQIGPQEFDWMREADCVLLDGPKDEPDGAGPGSPTGQAALWVNLLQNLPARHKVLLSHGAQAGGRDSLTDCGFALAYDGMEIHL
jgi:pyrroloquinoline quinone biosynthesis protein B